MKFWPQRNIKSRYSCQFLFHFQYLWSPYRQLQHCLWMKRGKGHIWRSEGLPPLSKEFSIPVAGLCVSYEFYAGLSYFSAFSIPVAGASRQQHSSVFSFFFFPAGQSEIQLFSVSSLLRHITKLLRKAFMLLSSLFLSNMFSDILSFPPTFTCSLNTCPQTREVSNRLDWWNHSWPWKDLISFSFLLLLTLIFSSSWFSIFLV